MPDIISPQEIDKKLSLVEEKIFDKDPVCTFCLSNLLLRISEEWDSGQAIN